MPRRHPFPAGSGARSRGSPAIGRRCTSRTCWPTRTTKPANISGLADYRAMLGVPLLRDGESIGVFIMARHDRSPSTPRQIELVADLRRPGRDRDRERAPVRRGAGEDPRPHGSAAAANRHRRHSQGHQPLGRFDLQPVFEAICDSGGELATAIDGGQSVIARWRSCSLSPRHPDPSRNAWSRQHPRAIACGSPLVGTARCTCALRAISRTCGDPTIRIRGTWPRKPMARPHRSCR